ncbi:MAG TPA: hypothetical protein VFU71_02845 [Burkholderiaceae bacterium]|nr:hypothetical protein [Burkholderiaceae bacterium]
MSDDLTHDAHLRAALRHAPDHALSPPAGVSRAILAAAWQAHRPARPIAAPPPRMRPAGRTPFAVWLQRLTSPRWAGVLASSLVAALGLGLWLDLATEPVVQRPDGRATTATPPPASNTEAETATGAGAPSEATAANETRDATSANGSTAASRGAVKSAPGETALVAAAPATAARPADRAAPRRDDHESVASQRPAADGRSVTEPAARQEKRATPHLEQARVRGDQAADAVAEARAPAAQPAAPLAEAATAAAPADAKAPTSGPGETRAAAAAPQSGPPTVPTPGATELRAALAPQGARKLEISEAATASPAVTLLQRVRAETAAGSARWTWAAPGSAMMAPFDDAAQAWLQRVAQAARGRWSEVSDRGETHDAIEARWWRDGWPHATLRIEADGLRWIEAAGIRHAPLDATTVQRLRTH